MGILRALVGAALAFLVFPIATAERRRITAEEPDDARLLCISECSTCPTICPPPSSSSTPPHLLLPPPPPPPTQTYTVHHPPPPPPAPKSNTPQPPPPNSLTITPAPPGSTDGGQKGGFSYPYYYFYTSKAHSIPRLTMVLPLLFLSICMFFP